MLSQEHVITLQVLLGAAVAVIFVTIWHEFGHLAAARLLGIPVKKLSLGLGPTVWEKRTGADFVIAIRVVPAGMSVAVPARREDDGRVRRPISHDMLVAAAGPAASLVLAGLFLLLGRRLCDSQFCAAALTATGALSAILALLNLAPIPGLDGGHLLVMTVALFGWELSPGAERKLHRTGLQAITGLAAIPLLFQFLHLII